LIRVRARPMITSGVHRGMSLAAAAHGSHFSRNSPIHVRRFRLLQNYSQLELPLFSIATLVQGLSMSKRSSRYHHCDKIVLLCSTKLNRQDSPDLMPESSPAVSIRASTILKHVGRFIDQMKWNNIAHARTAEEFQRFWNVL